MNFFHTIKFAQYLIFSGHNRGHGIHSPFIFDLVSRVFRNKIDKDVVCCIEAIRKNLISDQRDLVVSDLGSGSGKSKKTEKVSEIARKSSVPERYGRLLANLASEFGGDSILELGTSFGISTMYLASALRERKVVTIEGSPARAGIAAESFSSSGFNNISILTGSFDEKLNDVADLRPGLIFIDGDHRKVSLKRYFERLKGISGDSTVIVIDDIYHSRDMSEAWEEIKKDERVTSTVDLFRMGIVFFRKGMSPKNYIIRY